LKELLTETTMTLNDTMFECDNQVFPLFIQPLNGRISMFEKENTEA